METALAAGTAYEPLQPFCNDDQMWRNQRDQLSRTMSHQTPTSVEFGPWPTDVDMDELWFGKLNFDVGAPLVTLIEASTSYSLPLSSPDHNHRLEADFVSIERGSVFRFTFEEVIAFRVLDENGLLELWDASSASPRPAKTTFRARGHAWTRESFLVFMAQGSETRFSYFVATEEHCLEVVCHKEPKLTDMGPARVTTARLNDR
ncbi:hypothetical protein [Methylobacterium sp. 37f]|uniref:hypothetical protein n=1 Tax=Methylobacterium sp. 37f TaxID=2817058 RepID=UPI001FFD09DE|nr:hypothetical protein [Methylobacterium sp. 37f]MCK2056714.1 hypothetical protein [Methylobacterium sp. 37f]